MFATIALLASATAATAQGFLTLHAFDAGVNGAQPSPLIQASDGNFYGTTSISATAHGTIFRMTPDGAITTLHSFAGAPDDGAAPWAGVIEARDGNFYGTTGFGGANDNGTIFRMTPAGAVTILHSFTGEDGWHTQTGLLEANNGNLYGGSIHGGEFGLGTIFRITKDGDFTLLHSFSSPEGNGPGQALIQAADGNLYGASYGPVFRMTLDGDFSVFSTSAEAVSIMQGRDGNFYGFGYTPTAFNLGTIFRLTPGGAMTVVHAFSAGADGAYPSGRLIQAQDDTFYGTTSSGGPANAGTIFAMTADGSVSTVHAFSKVDGNSPSGVMQAADGNLYGTTLTGGRYSGGAAFRVAFSCNDTLTLGYANGTLSLGFALKTSMQADWGTWLITPAGVTTLWFTPLPIVSPGVSFTIPIPGFPSLGTIGVLTVLKPASGPICADFETVTAASPTSNLQPLTSNPQPRTP